jgi:hypothetical protein
MRSRARVEHLRQLDQGGVAAIDHRKGSGGIG